MEKKTEVVNMESINKMRLCWFCRESEDFPYTEMRATLHERDGLHYTLGKTWAPAKKHPEYEYHTRWLHLLT